MTGDGRGAAAAPGGAVGPGRRRRPGPKAVRTVADLWLFLGAAVLLVLTSVPADTGRVSGAERAVFRAVNDTLTVPFVLVWPVMQLGNLVAVPVAAVVAAVLRRFRLAASILAGGAAVYVIAKVIKRIVERGRPAEYLDNVVIHGSAAQGLGYVSGHAAVSFVLATVIAPYVARRWRWVPYGVAVLVCLARMYVGAHLPLDVVGGAALGIAAGALVRLAIGRPAA